MKHLAALAGAGAMLLSAASPALAYVPMPGTMNTALVKNTSFAYSETGSNVQATFVEVEKAGVCGEIEIEDVHNYIDTGSARSYSDAVVVANVQLGCSWCTPKTGMNMAFVTNDSQAYAFTGTNVQQTGVSVLKAHIGGEIEIEDVHNYADTGHATSNSDAWTVVNTSWTPTYHFAIN